MELFWDILGDILVLLFFIWMWNVICSEEFRLGFGFGLGRSGCLVWAAALGGVVCRVLL